MATTSGVATGAATGAVTGAATRTTFLGGDSMTTDLPAIAQFQLYTFRVDFPDLQQAGRQVVL